MRWAWGNCLGPYRHPWRRAERSSEHPLDNGDDATNKHDAAHQAEAQFEPEDTTALKRGGETSMQLNDNGPICGRIGRGVHAALALAHGSICSSSCICSSESSAMLSCLQPVLRKMWMARERAGERSPLKIMLA